jgi:DNA-binding HxlR family transcriptional regulator
MSASQPAQPSPQHSELCPRYHRAVELIGKRWTGAIVLRELEAEDIVKRQVFAESPVRVTYELTCSGRELGPALDEIARWAERWIQVSE